MSTCTCITKAEVKRLGVKPIPTMNILTVKMDESGRPLRAKSRTVVLGNEEERCWSRTLVNRRSTELAQCFHKPGRDN